MPWPHATKPQPTVAAGNCTEAGSGAPKQGAPTREIENSWTANLLGNSFRTCDSRTRYCFKNFLLAGDNLFPAVVVHAVNCG
mmetsp:Transcript_2815/g.6475  ORF Transcript_2815/g.6475 Transcript_2815/m.6475 type:complete len:82 (+) Transcript_2815:138-383(+)